MSPDPEQRLERLEAHLAHVERQNEDLNEVLIEQGKSLARLQVQIRRIAESVERAELDRVRSTQTRPPHHG